jgi:hypothetical protein
MGIGGKREEKFMSEIYDDVLDKLRHLPSEEEREYEVLLTNIATSDYSNLKDKLQLIIDNKALAENLRYAAFFCLATYYRRKKDISLNEKLVKTYEIEFKNHPTYRHLYLLYLKTKGLNSNNIIAVIELAYESQIVLKNHSGAIHCFAESVAEGYEEFNESIKNKIKIEWLQKAKLAIDKAIELDLKYAKYYCTKGRILAIDKQFVLAKEAIRTAMDYEDSDRTDYIMRIGLYQYYLIKVQTKEYNTLIETQIKDSEKIFNEKLRSLNKTYDTKAKEVDNKIKENNIHNLEFLGFFIAIVSFTLGSFQLASGEDFDNALKLIIILFASILIVFSAFGIMLHKISIKEIHKTPNFLMFMIGIVMYFIIILWR